VKYRTLPSSTYPEQVEGLLQYLSDDQQSHVGNKTEHKDQCFVQCDERVYHHVEGFSGNGKPFAVYSVGPVSGTDTDQRRDNQQCYVQNRAPHEKCSDTVDIHDIAPLSFCVEQLLYSLHRKPHGVYDGEPYVVHYKTPNTNFTPRIFLSFEEREKLFELGFGGAPAVFAYLERLGVTHLLAFFFAVQLNQLVAILVGG
jgi:hypothetical protein